MAAADHTPVIEATATKVRENKRTVVYEGDEADLILQKLAVLHTPGVRPGEWPSEVRLTIELHFD